MRIIVVSRVRAWQQQYSNLASVLESWISVVHAADWRQFSDIRETISSADSVTLPKGNVITVFNISGFRLLTHVKFNTRCIYIKTLLTHDEYDRDTWKDTYDYD